MEFEIGGRYGKISAADYNTYSQVIDLTDFMDGGDGYYYIAEEDYDTEIELLDYEVTIDFFTYIKSTQNVGGTP